MYKFITSMLVLLSLSCNTKQKPNVVLLASNETKTQQYSIATKEIINPVSISEPYELTLKINKLEQDTYNLIIRMYLNNDSYYASPNSKRDLKGIFSLVFDENNKITLASKLKETPLSVEASGPHPFPYDNGTVNWIRENTIYHQKLKPSSNENFSVSGYIQFTIEPRCTLEKIPFTIKYNKGEMIIKTNNKC
ncbi:MAG: hypothetical protein V3U92_13015 [Cellulophaga sp.]